jgi:hypothetical protein
MMLLRKPRQLWPSGARFGLVLSLATSLIVMLAAQTPVEEKEESKPPKLRSDLPLLPPLESLQKIVVQPLGELMLEAERTSHPAVRDLLRRLAYPHDRVVLRNGSVLRVAPLARPLEQEKAAQLKLQVITPTGQLETQRAVARDEVLRVEYFERFAIQEVLQLGQETGAGKSPMKQSQVLRLAEFVLEQLLAFHGQGIRAEGWGDVQKQLQQQLKQTRLQCLAALQQENQWQEATAWADRLLEEYKGDAEIVAPVSSAG